MAATATPLADPNKFTTIAHGTHRYLSPLSAAKAESLIQRLAVAPGQRVLDVGCGKAGFLLDLLAAAQARGVGVDTNPAFIAAATAAARERGLSERAEFVNARLQDTIDSRERFDAVVCMGSSQVIGSLADAFAWAWAVLAPGAVALFGDGLLEAAAGAGVPRGAWRHRRRDDDSRRQCGACARSGLPGAVDGNEQ